MRISQLLQRGRGYVKQVDAMEGVPSIVGWIILAFFLYLVFRVWKEIEKDKNKGIK
jgi:hypothetical protein